MAVRRVASVAAATAAHSVLALALSVLLSRVLGPEGRGSYALLTMAAIMGAALGTFGFESTSVFILGRHPDGVRTVLAASLVLSAVSGTTIASLIVWSATGPVPWLPQTARGLVLMSSLAIPFLILSALLNGALIGLGRVAGSAWLGTGAVALSLVLVSLASVTTSPEGRLRGVIAAFTLCAVVQAGMPLLLVANAAVGPFVDPRRTFEGGVGYSLSSHASTALHMLHLRADVFLVGVFLGPREVGWYALAQAVCEWVWLLPRSAAAVLFPFVAGSDKGRALAATMRTCRVVFSLAGLAALGLALAASWLIPALFGSAFGGSVLPIRVLLPGIWLGSIAGTFSSFLAGCGRPELPLLTSLASLTLNVSLNLALIPRYGIAGAAASSAVSYSLMTAINVVFSRRVAPLALRDFLLLRKTDILSVWEEMKLRGGPLPRPSTSA
jgi:O-antigen/teichoic acid export membrane protein